MENIRASHFLFLQQIKSNLIYRQRTLNKNQSLRIQEKERF